MAQTETLLSQAQTAFNGGDYSRARSLAEDAGALTYDIDSDGIPNDSDFSPEIINNYIYASAAILLAVATGSGLKWSARHRIKRQEKERREKMKQDILDMIDEVIKEI
ncbi:MAG: hypothetical protein SVY15_03990 [Halobacteriota archaeon]|nr:hypothetical protein [Halobacteriota archaeon]